MFTCVKSIPVPISFFNKREGGVFDNYTYCTTWGVIWKHLQSLSVFMTGVLSVTRTIALIKPMMPLKKRNILIVIIVYAVFINLQMIGPIFTNYGKYIYFKDVLCWEYTGEMSYLNSTWYSIAVYTAVTIQQAFPIVPIIASCLISSYVVLSSMNVSNKSNKAAFSTLMKRHATITIVYVTLVYIICNIPYVINQVLYLNFIVKQEHIYPDPYWNSTFMLWYSWNITHILSVSMNATINPLIYFSRIRKYRSFVLESLGLKSKPIRHSTTTI